MVTKSKNSRKAKIIKIISAVMAVVCGAIALFSGIFMLYAWDNTRTDALFDRTQRHRPQMFMTMERVAFDMIEASTNAVTVVNNYKNEDYFQNVYLKQVRAELEQSRESYINEQINEYGVSNDMYEWETEPYTDAYTYEPATAVGGEEETTTADSNNTQDDYQQKYEEAREYWYNDYDIESRLSSRESSVRYALDSLEGLVDLKVYAVNSDDGTVYTNIKEGDALTTIRNLPFCVYYRSEDQTLAQLHGVENERLNEHFAQSEYGENIEIFLGVDTDNLATDVIGAFYTYYEFYDLCAYGMDVAVWALPIAGVLFLLFLIATLVLAGCGPLPEAGTEEYRRKVERFGGTIDGREPVLRNGLDAIPNDLHLILSLGLMVLSAILADYFVSMDDTNFIWSFAIIALSSAAFSVLLVELCTSIARNAKAGHYWHRTLIAAIGRGFKRFGRWIKFLFSPMGHHFKGLQRYVRRWLLLYFVVMIPLSLIPFLPVFIHMVVVLSLWRSIASLDKLIQYVQEVQSGNLNATLDTSKFPKWMLPFTEDIVHLRDGMQAAVEEALKSERLKTELITNVSHDLKTPLTSIINYTGLLDKCDIQDPQAREYIAVLQNKSDRLKHLIEDLVEASKASTGNIEFHPVRLNLYEMAVQAVGENEDVLAKQGVTVVVDEPEAQPAVWADSQKTWRVVENLLSNVRKYSMPGTRAYITVRTEGDFGVLTVKNISREELNISPEELMERFVRGDSSRSTEGSGLGLSIAQNLCEKQGGKFEIEIDGDLFKATVRLPLAPENAVPPVPHPDYIQVDPPAGQL